MSWFSNGLSLKNLFPPREETMWVEGFWCNTPVKLPNKITTPLGSKVTVVTMCVDVEYTMRERKIVVLKVRLALKNKGASGQPRNMSAERVGESFFAYSITPHSILLSLVDQELGREGSNMRRVMYGQWGGKHGWDNTKAKPGPKQ